MSTPSNANVMAETQATRVLQPAEIPVARLLYWSVARELWETRSLYLAPLAVAALFFAGFLISVTRLPHQIRTSALDPAALQASIQYPYSLAALLLMGVTFVVAIFYCLDALYGERRDRSILFWKSLPVSDSVTVVAKGLIPLLVLPLITFAVTIATQIAMLVVSNLVLLGSGLSVTYIWNRSMLFEMPAALFLHLLLAHGLWYAPFYGWLLLVSAWAKRAPLLWAVLPLVALGFFEKLAFNSAYLVSLIVNRLGSQDEPSFPSDSMSYQHLSHFALRDFFFSPGLWLGLVFFAATLFAAIRIRRYQSTI